MRRRWVLALVLATALVFTGVGVAVGYWGVPEGKSAADCEAAVAYDEAVWRRFSDTISEAATFLRSEAFDNMRNACLP